MLLKYLRLTFISNANDIVTAHAHTDNESKAMPKISYLMWSADWVHYRMKAYEAWSCCSKSIWQNPLFYHTQEISQFLYHPVSYN